MNHWREINIAQVFETEVLIIGGGGAGFYAAVKAREQGASVLLVNKGLMRHSGCTVGADAIQGVGPWSEPWDSKDLHFKDTIVGGGYINNQILARILVEEAPERIVELDHFGAIWERFEDGSYAKRGGGLQTYPRAVIAPTEGGSEMLNALWQEAIRSGVEMLGETMVTRLLTYDGAVTGATALDLKHGNFILIKSKSTILATGGASWVWPANTGSIDRTGDGFLLAYDAGAVLMDMEMFQFYPGCWTYPKCKAGIPIVVEQEPHVYLFNALGERFMLKYDPEWAEATTRDKVTRCIHREVQEGRGSPRGGVWGDMRAYSKEILELYARHWLEEAGFFGIDLMKERIEMGYGTALYNMGGVRINEKCESNISGLYAAGELAGGIHGANRLGCNSLPDLLVFGARAGKYAAERALDIETQTINRKQFETEQKRVFKFLNARDGVAPKDIWKKLHDAMYRNAGIIRSEQSLNIALAAIEHIKRKDLPRLTIADGVKRYNMEWREALETRALVFNAEMIVRSALFRTETRGAHYREDFPFTDNVNWLKNVHLSLHGGKMKIWAEPAVITELEPQLEVVKVEL